MNNYYKIDFHLSPFSEDAADLLAGFLSEKGFESFVCDSDLMTAYVKEELYSPDSLPEIIDTFPIKCDIQWEESLIEGRDWNQEWEQNYFQPIVLDKECVVHATFHTEYPRCKYDITIDPRMAFGTGHHATTCMMVSHLLNLDCNGCHVIDMGTGTGILSILAAMRGSKEVDAIEIDPMACENAIENAALNNVNINFICGDANSLRDLSKADIFLANINRNIILADLSSYAACLKPDGKLILSGFYENDVPILERALMQYGMEIAKKVTNDERCSLLVTFKK